MNKNKQILKYLSGRPLMIIPTAVEALLSMDFGSVRIEQNKPQASMVQTKTSGGSTGLTFAVIPVFGTLTHRTDIWNYYWFGDMSYEMIRKMFRSAINDKDIDGIIFDIDSPGGEVAGCFDLVDEIYEARKEKPIYAIVNEFAFSAAYTVASAAETIYIPRTGETGSIGVISVHLDISKWDEDIGLKYTAIYAGKHKNDFTAHEPLSDEAYRIAKQSVDENYELFVKTVARNRNLEEDSLRKTEAGIFSGENALKQGLVDHVMSFNQAVADISNKITQKQGGTTMALKEDLTKMINESGDEAVKVLAETGFVKLDGELPEPVDVGKITADARAEGQNATLERVNGILDLCTMAKMPELAGTLINDGVSVEDAKKKILEARAGLDNTTEISSTVGALPGGAENNPLIADARRRAGKEE